MTVSLDLYLSKNREDRKIMNSTKGEAVKKNKTKNKNKKNKRNKIVQETETEGGPASSALQPPAIE